MSARSGARRATAWLGERMRLLASARWGLVMAGAAVAVAGCGELSTTGSFEGRTYVSDRVEQDGQSRALVEGTQLMLSFDDDAITASAGCNLFSGSGGIADGRLVIEDLAGTEMACEPALMEQEQWWAALLSSQPQAQVGDRELTLIGSGGTVTMVALETIPDAPLEETAWQLDTVVMHGAASSVPEATASTLTVSGGALRVVIDDCRDTEVPVGVEPAQLVLAPDAFPVSECRDGAAFVDRAIASVLGAGEVPYVIEGDVLRLTGPFGWGLGYRAP
jgi:heat shock protein HslJ